MAYFQKKQIDKVQQCLELARHQGASGAAIELNHGNSYSCSYEAGRLKHTALSESLRYDIQVLVNGRRGTASGNVMDAMENMLERALTLAKIGAVSHFDQYPAPGTYAKVKFCSNSLKLLTRDKLIADCGELVETMKEWDPDMEIEAGGGHSESEGFIANTGGFFQPIGETSWALGAGFTKITGEDMLFAGESRTWGEVNHLYDIAFLKNKLQEDFTYGSRLAEFKGAKLPVLLAPPVVRQFMAPILGALNGRDVYKGISPMREKLGKAAFASNLTITDQPHLDFAPGSAVFDNVGLPTQPVTLIEQGRINMFLYDYDSAHLAGVAPTAHSGCTPYNSRITPGNCPAKQMLATIKRGIYVQSLLGFGQSNLANGDFSCNIAVGYLVENGEIIGRIKNSMIAGNIFDLCSREFHISSDYEANFQTPHFFFPEINLTTKQ